MTDKQVASIRRERLGAPPSKTFRHLDTKGQEIVQPRVWVRIRKLAIPPAWEHVWISPKANGHLQATGLDVKGRKQYRYHADWMQRRGETKFHRLHQFGQHLPAIRRQLDKTLNAKRLELSRAYVLTALIGLLDRTLIRIGNAE